jgi:putative toxin-antitoxin system antitoxin component (TIGR02293 family)
MGMSALAEVLGIEEPQDESALIELTRHGLPGAAIDTLARNLGITVSELSHYLHVSSRTLMRHRGKLLDKHLSDHLLTIGSVVARCSDLFQSPEKASRWLKSPSLALGNSRPLDLLDTTAGAGMVLNLLGRIEYGVFS